jgi:hypothetical protein
MHIKIRIHLITNTHFIFLRVFCCQIFLTIYYQLLLSFILMEKISRSKIKSSYLGWHSGNTKKTSQAQVQWLKPGTLFGRQRSRRFRFKASWGRKFQRPPSQLMAGHRGTCLSSQLHRETQTGNCGTDRPRHKAKLYHKNN